METYSLPEGWESFDADALGALEATVRAGYIALGGVTAENLERGEAYSHALESVKAEQANRLAQAERVDRVAQAFATITEEAPVEVEAEVVVPDTPEELIEETPVDANEETIVEPIPPTTPAANPDAPYAAPEDDVESPAPAPEAPAAEPAPEEEVVEGAQDQVEVEVEVEVEETPNPAQEAPVNEENQAVTASAPITVPNGALAVFNNNAAAADGQGLMPVPYGSASLVASAGLDSTQANTPLAERLAQTLVTERLSLDEWGGARTKYPVAYASQNYGSDRTLTRDEAHNAEVMDMVGSEWASMTAAGPICIPEATEYEILRMHQAQSPVESGLPLLGSGQASVRIQGEPSWAEARAGVFAKTYTEMEDTTVAESGTYVPKPYARFSCPAVVEYKVSLRGVRARFDNLEVEVNSPFVQECINMLLTAHAESKDTFYLDAIETASGTAVPWDTNGYGATRNLFHGLLTAVHALNKRSHRGPRGQVTAWLPDAAAQIIAADMINDHSMGMGLLSAGLPDIAREANRLIPGLDLRFYYHEPTTQVAAGVGMFGTALDGAVHRRLPLDVRAYMYPTGSMFRQDAGTLNLGFIRDSELNNTNDVEFFVEQWIGVVPRSTHNIAVDFNLIPSGAGPTGAPIYDGVIV